MYVLSRYDWFLNDLNINYIYLCIDLYVNIRIIFLKCIRYMLKIMWFNRNIVFLLEKF